MTQIHRYTRREIVQGLTVATLAAQLTTTQSTQAARLTASKKLLFFTKSSGFEHDVVKRKGEDLSFAERVLTEYAKKLDIDLHCSKDGRIFDKDYDQFDGFFFYTSEDLTRSGTDKQPPMSKQGKANLLAAIEAGKGFLGSHCASDTFHSSGRSTESQREPDPYIRMIGGEFIRHGEQQKATMKVASQFPGAPSESFQLHEEWYSLKNFTEDIHVILIQQTEGMKNKDYERPAYPATWARRHGKGRVFYTSMGHREDVWTNPIFENLVAGGLRWALGMIEAEIPSNLATTCPGASVMPPLKS